jgi:hypothetical protein
MPVDIEVDFAKTSGNQLFGALTIPSQQLTGLPLSVITVSGTSITFGVRTDQSFSGTLNGASIFGDFALLGYTLPFTLMRTGEAQIAPTPTSSAISKALEGSWTGTIIAGGSQMQVDLRLANDGRGRSTGVLVNRGQGSITVPVATILESGRSVTPSTR